MKNKERKFGAMAIAGLVRGRSWQIICGEDSYYYVSYDGFRIEQKMNELRGMFPECKFKIVEIEMRTFFK